MLIKEKEANANIKRLFFSLMPAAAVSGSFPGVATLLTGLAVGHFVGQNGLAVLGYFSPFVLILAAICRTVCIGARDVYGKYMAQADKDGIQQVFSASVFLCVGSGGLLTLLSALFPQFVAQLLGASADVFSDVTNYLRYYGFGIPFILLLTLFLVFLQFNGEGKISTVIGFLTVGLHLAGILLNFLLFHGGMGGVGVVNTVVNLSMALLALALLCRKHPLFRFAIGQIRRHMLRKILVTGVPEALEPLLQFCRNRVINYYAFALYGTAGVSAISVAYQISSAVGGFILAGYAGALGITTNILVNERDVTTLRALPKLTARPMLMVYGSAYLLVFCFARPLSLLFGATPETLALCVMTMRLVNAWFLSNILKQVVFSTYHAMGRDKLMVFFLAIDAAVMPILCCVLFANSAGIWMVAFANPLGEIAAFFAAFLYFVCKNRRLPKSILRVTDIPNTLSVPKADRFEATVQTVEEAVQVSEAVIAFCKEKQLPSQKAFHCGLCLEELAVFRLEHKQSCTIDIRLIYENGKMRILFRDNGEQADPVAWIALCKPEDRTKSLGIRMIQALAEEMNYTATLGLNILTVTL